jgi:hypothetical protein
VQNSDDGHEKLAFAIMSFQLPGTEVIRFKSNRIMLLMKGYVELT